jgi:biopolymer transport protein ExbB/TolQ
MSLSVQPEHAGKTARCPGCNHKFTVPKSQETTSAESSAGANTTKTTTTRVGWVESDPANPNVWIALVLGVGIMFGILLFGLILQKTYIYTILYERGWVNFAETFVFSWGMGIIILKFQKLAHQKNALLLDVLPQRFGREINTNTVSQFIDHVYKLPKRLRDSLMVNRIRKGLELFEVRPNNSDVAHMMSTQSDIDSIRIAGSYSLIKVFIWAIPILGFVGTVLGLSAAIGNFQGVMGGAKDIDSLMGSLGGVTSGLGTSFDTTLLGLVYSILMSFPMSALQKSEDDNLNSIDAFCNETLLPRLNDGGGSGGSNGDIGGALDRVVEKLVKAQSQFLTDLNNASGLVREQVENLEKRANTQSEAIMKSYVETMKSLQKNTNDTLATNVTTVTAHVAALEKALNSLNSVLQAVAERQVHVELKPRGFFRRWFGRS